MRGSFQLLAGGNQRIPILQGPPVILSVGNFQAIRVQLFSKSNHLLEMIEILTMHYQIHRERNRKPANHSRQNDFVRVRLRACNPVRGLRPANLEN